ncbi:winged helix-turn-helix domain-containing protein [Levilinea saccharolytica]|uniref:winged helix-turn-helix domain-containing protein n=1 Tax=Levilinea saccharolytica TaxID=229921 RepID=UPI0009467336|nr:winged helix-turn-helix domain-containing protein [Levilinea saccharolytica]
MKRVLLADDDKGYLESCLEYFADAGYQVIAATSLEETRWHLENTWVHLAVLDIRWEKDNTADQSGLILAMDPAYAHIPKVINTGFSDVEKVRLAMSETDEGVKPAVEYVDKLDGADVLVERVKRAFQRHVRVNFDLPAHSLHNLPAPFHSLAAQLPGAPLGAGFDLWAGELEDLFRRVFYPAAQLLVGRVLWRDENALGLEILAADEQQRLSPYTVLVGGPQTAEAWRAARQTASAWLPAPAAPTPPAQRSVHFYALAQPAPGLDLAVPFFTWLKQAQPTAARAGLQNWLSASLTPSLNLHRRQLFTPSLPPLSTRAELLAALQPAFTAAEQRGLAQVTLRGEQLTLHFPGGASANLTLPELTEPALSAFLQAACEQPLVWGGQDLSRLYVTEGAQPAAADPLQGQPLPLALELARLEMQVRREAVDDSNLLNRWDFERQLLAAPHLGEFLSHTQVEPGCRSALAVLTALRHLWNQQAGAPQAAYESALLAAAAQALTQVPAQRPLTAAEAAFALHALMLLALLAEKARQSPASAPAQPTAPAVLTLDETTSEAVYAGKRVHLSNKESLLLGYFLQHEGQLCTRAQIAQQLLDAAPSQVQKADGLVNTNMDRLRSSLKRIAGPVQFIETIPTKGYIFHSQPVS